VWRILDLSVRIASGSSEAVIVPIARCLLALVELIFVVRFLVVLNELSFVARLMTFVVYMAVGPPRGVNVMRFFFAVYVV
jgi:hypothetical protein